MSLSPIVGEVAAAILRGRVLHAGAPSDEPSEGEWGVLDTERATDAFDPHGRGWIGSGIEVWTPSRYDYEAAARLAATLSGPGRAYEPVRLPAPPTRPLRATVGPLREACSDRVVYRCVDWTSGAGLVVASLHVVPRVDEAGMGHLHEDDPSPFGAALAFVRFVGKRAAREALDLSDF